MVSALASVVVASLRLRCPVAQTLVAPRADPESRQHDAHRQLRCRSARTCSEASASTRPASPSGLSPISGSPLYSGDGGLKSAGVNVGTWNSLNTGDTGCDGPTGKLWYESDFYATLGLGFGGGTSLATTYTAYTSPNNTFTTVKEIMFKLGVDDTRLSGEGGAQAVRAGRIRVRYLAWRRGRRMAAPRPDGISSSVWRRATRARRPRSPCR